jgi:hypothetical protein
MCPATGHGINSLAVPVSVHEGFDSVVGDSGGDRKRAWPPCTASTAWRGVSEKPRRRPHALHVAVIYARRQMLLS